MNCHGMKPAKKSANYKRRATIFTLLFFVTFIFAVWEVNERQNLERDYDIAVSNLSQKLRVSETMFQLCSEDVSKCYDRTDTCQVTIWTKDYYGWGFIIDDKPQQTGKSVCGVYKEMCEQNYALATNLWDCTWNENESKCDCFVGEPVNKTSL